MMPIRRLALLVMLCALPGTTGPAAGQSEGDADGPPEPKLTAVDVVNVWGREAAYFAQRYISIDGTVYCMPLWDPRYPSSRLTTVERVQADHRKRIVEGSSAGLVYYRDINIPREEAIAQAVMLPDLEPGSFGYVHSFRVAEIKGKNEMLVDTLWLIDADALEQLVKARKDSYRQADMDADQADQRIELEFSERLKLLETQDERSFKRTELLVRGIPTQGLKVGDRYPSRQAHAYGLHMAVITAQEIGSGRRSELQPVLMPVDVVAKNSLDEAAFKALLAERGFDERAFATRLIWELQKEPEGHRERMFALLEAARPGSDKVEPEKAERSSTRSLGTRERDTDKADKADKPDKAESAKEAEDRPKRRGLRRSDPDKPKDDGQQDDADGS